MAETTITSVIQSIAASKDVGAATLPLTHMSSLSFCHFAKYGGYHDLFTEFTTKRLDAPQDESEMLDAFMKASNWVELEAAFKVKAKTVNDAKVVVYFDKLIREIASKVPEKDVPKYQQQIQEAFNEKVDMVLASLGSVNYGSAWGLLKSVILQLKY